MVVSKIPYERYKIESLREAFEFFKRQCNEAKTAEDVIKARTEFTEEIKKFSTAASPAASFPAFCANPNMVKIPCLFMSAVPLTIHIFPVK